MLARLVDSGGEKSASNEAPRQLRSSTSRGTGRVVHFSVCSSGDEGVDDSVLPRNSAPRGGRELTAVTDADVHAVDPVVASKFNFLWVVWERLLQWFC